MTIFSRIRNRRGFTLLEMALVVVILALIATAMLTFVTAQQTQKARLLTNARLDEIQRAIVAFRGGEHRIPCPGDATVTTASANFGVEAANPGSCTGGAIIANFTAANLAIGAVPTKSLGLADDFMYDGWGRRLTYAVDTRATAACSATTYGLDDATVGLTVNDASGVARTNYAWYVLVSHGMSGHGAYMPSGARRSTGSTNTDELNNCNCSSAAAPVSPPNGIFVDRPLSNNSASLTDRYDDVVRYAIRSQIRSEDDNLGTTEVCP